MSKRKINFYIVSFFLLVISISVGVGVGFYLGSDYTSQHYNYLASKLNIASLIKAASIIKNNYVGQLDYQKLLHGAIKGLVKGVGDDYTVYFSPKEAKVFQQDISGSFEGVGMEIGIKNGQLTVIAPIEGTPAFKAGILAGDKILKIGNTITTDVSVEKAAEMIRGRRGTAVKLTIYRKGWESPKEIKITRDTIIIPWVRVEFLDNNIAHLTISQFTQNVSEQFQKACQQIFKKGSKKIILDLRNDPGGLLDKAQEIAGWFLDRGDVVLYEKTSDGNEIAYRAKGNGAFRNYKVVVLVNKGTASAAEILAAALKDNRKDVKLIGEKTFGKGSVQEAIKFSQGLIKVTTAYWLTPSKKIINKVGIEPDIKVEMTEQDYKNHRDPQLRRAIEEIKK